MFKDRMTETQISIHLVTTYPQLTDAAEQLLQFSRVSVDLEADSMFHFREKVCLIQFGVPGHIVVVDPLELPDLDPLKPLFARGEIQKIFHGSDYDIRSLFRDFGIEVNNLFDTELASRFLGARSSGLDSVLGARFGVSLDKKYQKKDWSQRPLPDGMIEYAARDVVYLEPLADMLIGELHEKGRLSWVAEECDLLSRVRPVENGDCPLFLKFKGAGKLDRRSLAILERILQFRMKAAEKRDKPLFKVLGNESVMRLTQARPSTPDHLKQVNALSSRQYNMYGPAILEAVNAALSIPDVELPRYPRSRPPSYGPGVPQRVKRIKAWRDGIAERLCIDPSILMTRVMITQIAELRPRSMADLDQVPDMKKWQKKELGAGLIRLLMQAER